MSSWDLQPVFDSLLFAVAVGVVLGLLLLVGPSFRRLSRRRRVVLIALRAAVVLLLLLGLLRPTHVSTVRKPQTAVLLVLFDQSRSMQLPHGGVQQSRWAAERELLQRVSPVLKQLDAKLALKIYGYDAALHPVGWQQSELMLPTTPDGEQTDIGSNLHEALQREVGKRLAGVVLLGDGVQTAFEPRYEIQEAARELGRLDCPLYAVPFGPLTDAIQSRDVAVQDLQDLYTVFVNNELALNASVRIRGYVNKRVPITLVIDTPDGRRETLGPTLVTARDDDEQVPVEFRYLPEQPGRYKLTLVAEEQPGELVVKNNRLSAFLRVLEGGLRVLYLEGELRWEQKFLRRALDASADMEVDFTWIDASHRDNWPIDLASVLEREYDVFLLGDLDSAALGEANLKMLAEQVDAGKGLAMLGGYHSFGAGGYLDTPLADVLPIEMDRFERQDFDAPIREDLHLPGRLRMQPIAEHPILQLSPDDNNDLLWQQLPPLSGANRFAGIKQAAGVRVLLESPRGDPLLVVGEYGRGRVVAMAGDSTWRWCMQGRSAEFNRFWRQVVLWLVRREDLRQDDVWVRLDQRRFHPDADVIFRAGVTTTAGEPLEDVELQAQLLEPEGGRREVRVSRQGDEWTGVIESVMVAGDYTIEVTALSGDQILGRGRAEFLVFDRDVELSNPAADHDQLARLAATTKEAGGRLVPPERLVDVLESLRDQPPEMEREVQSKWQLADTSRDAWLYLAVFVLLLAAEWFLRKRWALV